MTALHQQIARRWQKLAWHHLNCLLDGVPGPLAAAFVAAQAQVWRYASGQGYAPAHRTCTHPLVVADTYVRRDNTQAPWFECLTCHCGYFEPPTGAAQWERNPR